MWGSHPFTHRVHSSGRSLALPTSNSPLTGARASRPPRDGATRAEAAAG